MNGWRCALGFVVLLGLACDADSSGGDASGGETAHSPASSTAHDGTEDTGRTGACAAELRADVFVAGMTKSGSSTIVTLVAADPAPPIKGDNHWLVAVTDLAGQPIADLGLAAVPFMPDHGHGSSRAVAVTPYGAPGQVRLSPVNLFMAGLWETTLTMNTPGVEDAVVFAFCVE